MLLITDRRDGSRSLQRMLALWGPCEVVGLHEAAGVAGSARSLTVSDVELADAAAVTAIRRALSRHRAADAPYLCLLRNLSPRNVMQANAIGATRILPADAPVSTLLETVNGMQTDEEERADGGGGQVRGPFVSAAAGMAETLSAAASGGVLPRAAIDGSVESINQAADSADIGAWLELVWKHDDSTYQHCLLVAGLAAAFGRQLGFAASDRRLLTGAAVLHDIGKAKIPLEILNKTESLDPAEVQVMRTHPEIGYEMLLRQGHVARPIAEAARSHHEYLDGSGYPDGLRGGEISDLVRLITICDIYAALIERRPYKAAMAPAEAYEVLTRMRGKLDADLVRAFRPVILPDAGSTVPAIAC